MPDDPSCRSEACAGRCKRSEHAMQFSAPSWVYGPCRIHRGCKRFVDVEPFLGPLTDDERAEIGRRMDLADERLNAADGLAERIQVASEIFHEAMVAEVPPAELPGPVAVAPETAPVVEQPLPTEVVVSDESRGHRRVTEEVISDGGRLIGDVVERVEGPAPQLADVLVPQRVRALFAEGGPLALKPKRFLGAWDSWWCSPCGSRAFEQRECCGVPMVAVRMEMHAREVPRGAP